jgi:hypothetical protein
MPVWLIGFVLILFALVLGVLLAAARSIDVTARSQTKNWRRSHGKGLVDPGSK